jgi:hypothetical protein
MTTYPPPSVRAETSRYAGNGRWVKPLYVVYGDYNWPSHSYLLVPGTEDYEHARSKR